MASFLLQPCKLREDRLVPTKDEPVSFEWSDLLKRVAPTESRRAKVQLRSMQVGAYVGTTKNPNPDRAWNSKAPPMILSNFIFLNRDRSGNVGWLLKRDPGFADRLQDVFRVESVDWGFTCEEMPVKS